MPEITFVEKKVVNTIPGHDLKIGLLGEIQDSDVPTYNGLRVLSCYGSLVSLDSPSKVWSQPSYIKVRPIENATVTLKFGLGGE